MCTSTPGAAMKVHIGTASAIIDCKIVVPAAHGTTDALG
jgi:hypothetical protein